MPCWERRTQTLDLAKANIDLVKEAAESIGLSVWEMTETRVRATSERKQISISYERGKLSISAPTQQGIEETVGEFKRAYSRAAVTRAAKKVGFQIQQKSERKLVLSRASFGR
jgi:hypothetical protein